MALRLVFIAAIFLCKPIASFAQDTIYRINGDTIVAQVILVNPEDVKYKKSGNTLGPTYTILRSSVKSIVYKNGSTIIIDGKQGEVVAAVEDTAKVTSLVEQEPTDSLQSEVSIAAVDDISASDGQEDAKKYYKKYKMAGLLTLTVSLISPLVGLVPAFTCSLKSPSETNLGYPDNKLAKNKTYAKAYGKEANKIKQTKIWTGWAIGLAVNYGLSILIFGN